MANDKKITRADTITLKSDLLPKGEARSREFANAKPTGASSEPGGYNFVLPSGTIRAGDVGSFFGPPSDFQAAMSDSAVQRIKAMPAPRPAPKQIIASGGKVGQISITDNPEANGDMPWYEFSGLQGVTENEKHIVRSAAKAGIDPDVLRSIIWMETTHGAYDKVAQPFDLNKSILPMNINTKYWGDTWGGRNELKDPQKNIDSGARMIKAISTAMPEQSLAHRATVYNNSSADKVSDYGARVQKIYEEKPWKKVVPRNAMPWFIPPLP